MFYFTDYLPNCKAKSENFSVNTKKVPEGWMPLNPEGEKDL
jgi:hypothetical protein